MRKQTVLCALLGGALVAVGGVARTVQKVSSGTSRHSDMTENVSVPTKGTVRMTPTKRTSAETSMLRQAQTCPNVRLLPSPTISDAVRQSAEEVDFAGMVIFTDNAERKAQGKAIWELTSEGGFGQQLSTAGAVNGSFGACVAGKTYYSIGSETSSSNPTYYLYSYDMNNGFALVDKKSVSENTSVSDALLNDGSTVYGCFYTATQGTYTFGTMDLTSATVTPVATVDWHMVAGAVDASGNLYGVIEGENQAYLARIDKQTGELTKIGNGLGVQPKYLTGAVIDPRSGRMFYNLCPADEASYLYEINIATGSATNIMQYPDGDEIVGMFMTFVPDPEAPGAPEDLTLSFPGGSLEGAISFKVPANKANGTPGSGQVTYTVHENGAQIAAAEVAYGADVNIPVTVGEAGNFTYIVELSNPAGAGYPAKASMFIGNDVPKSPESVTASWMDGTMTLAWKAVTEGVNGGYVDPARITYTITCGDRVVKENLADTTFSEPVAENGRYRYAVVATFNGADSEAALSNSVSVGSRSLPAEFKFETADEFEEFNVIDANNDGKTWVHYPKLMAARCEIHTTNAMDDWLIAPPVEMKVGKRYKITTVLTNRSTMWTGNYEIKIGQGDTVEAMTTELTPPTDIMTRDQIAVESQFEPSADGRYNVGIHGMCQTFYLYVHAITIEEIDLGIPGQASDLAVIPDPSGVLSARIDFKAPEKNLAGNPLTDLEKVELRRGQILIKTFEAPAPGSALTYTDTGMETGGVHVYSVQAYNDRGAGEVLTDSAYVGLDVPVRPDSVAMTEVGIGRVRISWSAPAEDVNGKPLDPSDITYEIRKAAADFPLVAEVGSVLQHEFEAVDSGMCDFVQYAVFPKNSTGRGDGTLTPFIAVGTPASVPYFENFDPMVHPLGFHIPHGSGSWGVLGLNGTVTSTPDGDGKFLAYKAGDGDPSSTAFTAKVDLTDVESPCFSFYTFNIASEVGLPEDYDINEVTVVAREANDTVWTVIKPTATVHDLCGGRQRVWGRVTADLEDFKGKIIQVGVMATCKYYTYALFDKWAIATLCDHNLRIENITAPATVNTSKPFPVKVIVSNVGRNDASAYSVELYDLNSGVLLTSASVEKQPVDTDLTVELNPVFAPGQTGAHSLYAKVVYDADMDAADNTSSTLELNVEASAQPAPHSLVATLVDGDKSKVNLQWTAPAAPSSVRRAPTPVTDDVESYDAWNYTGVGDWKFVDKDGKPSGAFNGVDVPGLTHGETVTSFYTFDRSIFPQYSAFDAHSGNKYFAAMYLYDDSQSNDWLISPALSGNAQTITFYARSYTRSYPERLQVYASTGSDDPDDFVAVEGSLVEIVPEEWTRYEVYLPAGTKRFAVRSFAEASTMLMLDDFTYEPGTGEDASLVGYNAYRDNARINAELIPVGTTSFVDDGIHEDTDYEYYVTAVYDNGEESGASNKVTILTSDVAGIGADLVTVSVINHNIVVDGASSPVTVADMNGMILHRGVGDHIVVAADKGVYLVSTGAIVRKVIVR